MRDREKTMLEKSVDLHVGLIKGEIKASAALILALVLGFAFFPLLMMLGGVLLLMIPLAVCGYRAQVKLFRRSLYGQGAELYQLLPLSPREILLGKAGAMIVWETAMLPALTVPAVVLYFRPNYLYGREIFGQIADTVGPGMSPMQKGILAGLLFLAVLISEFACCMYMALAQNLIQRFTGNIAAKAGDYPCVIAAGLVLSLIILGGRQAAGLLGLAGTALFWFIIGKYALILATGVILYALCRDNLEKAYGR